MGFVTAHCASSILPSVPHIRLNALPTQQGMIENCGRLERVDDTDDEREIISFLSSRSSHAVVMSSFILDHGLVSHHHRGQFYTYRDSKGQLEGVALIGHAIFCDARTERALKAFSLLARDYSDVYLVMGEEETIRKFWTYFAEPQAGEPRLLNSGYMLELRTPFAAFEPMRHLRPAIIDETTEIMNIQAQMLLEESGTNPLKTDPAGFRKRCLRRAERGRTWVLRENDQLIFKADIIAETPDAIYLEGVYVTPDERGKGYGKNCLLQLGSHLLERVNAIYLYVDDKNMKAQSFYQSIGCQISSRYSFLYF